MLKHYHQFVEVRTYYYGRCLSFSKRIHDHINDRVTKNLKRCHLVGCDGISKQNKLKIFYMLLFFSFFQGSKEQTSTQHTSYQKSTSKSLDLTIDSDNLGINWFLFLFSCLFYVFVYPISLSVSMCECLCFQRVILIYFRN